MIAVIPIKCLSERVPKKNLRMLGAEPLLCHVLRSIVLAGTNFDEVWVDTDCDEISLLVEGKFPEVRVHRRMPTVLGTRVSMNAVLSSFLTAVEGDDIFQTHVTNPFLDVETINGATAAYVKARKDGYDSVFSARRIQARFWTEGLEAINHSPSALIPTQDLPPVILETSTFYIFPREMFMRFGSRLGDKPLPYEVSEKVGFDIDTEEDFHMAEVIWRGLNA